MLTIGKFNKDMYEDKLKEELLKKIKLQNELYEKMVKIEGTDLDDDYRDKLTETNEEYRSLLDRCISLDDEIDSLLIDTKYYPLSGLTEEQLNNIGDGPEFLPEVIELSTGEKTSEFINEKAIEKYLDIELARMREEMKRRVGLLKPLKLTAEIDSRTRFLYKQVTNCYTFGFFDACCVLCRAIVETIAKRYIEFKGYGHLLVGKDKKTKLMSVQDILKNTLGISNDIIGFYSKISNKADNILHNKDVQATEEVAFSSIDVLHSFLRKFPRTI